MRINVMVMGCVLFVCGRGGKRGGTEVGSCGA